MTIENRNDARIRLLAWGRHLEYATLAWNVVGIVILAIAAISARSVALAGFGLDSLIEIGASIVVLWELVDVAEERQRQAMRFIGSAFVVRALYLTVQSTIVLVVGVHSSPPTAWTTSGARRSDRPGHLRARTGRRGPSGMRGGRREPGPPLPPPPGEPRAAPTGADRCPSAPSALRSGAEGDPSDPQLRSTRGRGAGDGLREAPRHGVYLASVPTMYRILREHDEVGDRRRHATHAAKKKPELVATKPNQVYSWDITKLHGPEKWTYYYLYSIIDIYSRYIPGWMLARAERASLAEALMAETIEKQGIRPGELTIHSDRGSPMIAQPVAHLLADLGVTKSHSRPHVSNDNPYSESHFRTLKYRPDFPRSFGSFEDAHAHCGRFFTWYNDDHRHSGIAFHTPADVHYGRAEAIRERRGEVLDAAYAAHPERFVRKAPEPPALPTVAWINEPKEDVPTTE